MLTSATASSAGASTLSRTSLTLLIVCMHICAVSIEGAGQTTNEREESSIASNQLNVTLNNNHHPSFDGRNESQVPSSTFRNEIGGRRSLLDSTDVCHICASVSKLRNGTLPNLPSSASSSGRGNKNNNTSLPDIAEGAPFPDEMTCKEWESYSVPLSADSSDCFDLRNLLLRRCCRDLPPLYKCQTEARHKALQPPSMGTAYDSSVPPITDDDDDDGPGTGSGSVDVGVVLNVSDITVIVNDIYGGVVEVVGTIRMDWTDGRLAWDGPSLGCTSATFAASGDRPDDGEIWVPALRHAPVFDDDGPSPPVGALRESRATVLSNGSVSWERRGTFTGRCEATEAFDKSCSVDFVDAGGEGGVRYFSRIIIGAENLSTRGYVLDEDMSKASSAGASSVPGSSAAAAAAAPAPAPTAAVEFHFQLRQMASVYNCSLCGGVGGVILPDAYPRESPWMEPLVPNQTGWSCGRREDAIASGPADNQLCLWSQAFFMDQCCSDPPMVRHQCEVAVRGEKIGRGRYDIAVAPRKKEISRLYDATDDDSVDVFVNLDVSHVLEVNIKKGTMQMQVSVELTWHDERLTWDPSSSGCYRASFRASNDHKSEIWVPEMDLVNMVDSIQNMPNSFASVYFPGIVWWKRTGIIEATCDLTGITKFPFDTLGCYIEFGSTRDPSFHRVNYLPGDVEYGRRFRGKSKHYQEYKLNTNQTEVTIETEDLSGFSNDLVRFQFYFARATRYYVKMFVLLYIFFTYLSFGMFLLDKDTGTRLGYGTSMLFVIVAQDITMAGMTPVTQEKLWIYEFSFGSKMFVLIGIVQTLVVLYLYLHNDFEDDATLRSSETTGNDLESVEGHETERLMKGSGDRIGSDHSRNSDDDGQSHKLAEAEPCPAQINGDSKFFRSENISRRPKILKRVKRKILKYEIKPNDSKRTKKFKKLRIVDRVFFFVFFISYSIFVGVMLSQVL